MATYFLSFLLAADFGPVVLQIAASVKIWHAIALLPAYAAVAVVTARAGLIGVVGVEFAVSILAFATEVSLTVVLSRYGAFDWLREIGTRTLPVYLVHFYPILIAIALLGPVAGSLRELSFLLPPALAVLAVLSALGFHRVTRRVPGPYRLPMTLRRVIVAKARHLCPASSPRRQGIPVRRPDE